MLRLHRALAVLALAEATDTGHAWDSCYGMFPPPAEILGYESATFTFPEGSGFTNNTMHYVRRKPVIISDQKHSSLA
jgi:hypothetical protein